MKQKLFSFFLALVAGAGTMFAWDYEQVSIGDLYYNLDATNKTAEVTYRSYSNSTYNEGWNVTTANIPSSVPYNSVPYSVTSIGMNAFRNCTGLTSVTIGNSVISIGEGAFAGCSGLTSVTIPNSVTSIGKRAFQECSGLTSVSVEAGNTVYDSRNNCNAIIETATNTLIFGSKNTTIPNSVTSIGSTAFAGCSGLKNVILGTSVKVLEESAFYGCSSIETITCYSMRPPTVNQDALYGLDYSTIVYVPADYQKTYQMHDAWGLYDVRPLGAKTIETADIKVTPADKTAEVAWPQVSGATTYELVIKDKSGNVICTLVFNANGQLTQIAFNAPARNNAPQQTQTAGFAFTVTGLNSGTTYNYTLTSKDAAGNVLDTQTGAFTTDGATALDNTYGNQNAGIRKVFENGQLYIILPDNTRYNLQGTEVK